MNYWGLEQLRQKKPRFVVFSSDQKLSEWINNTNRRFRSRVQYKQVTRVFKFNQHLAADFVEKYLDTEIIDSNVFDEMDELHKQYIKRRCHQLENYIQ